MRKSVPLLASLALALVLAGGASLTEAVRPADAVFPGHNGKIAFEGSGRSDVFVMNPDGSDLVNLTESDHFVYDGKPAFSPNGRKIAFASDRSGTKDIFTMSADGTHQHRVTITDNGPETDPAWSPEGKRIAFTSYRNGNTDIYVINRDRSGLRRLTTSPGGDREPAFSPDGTKIVFERGGEIWKMKAARESETNRAQRLTTNGPTIYEWDPVWSPDGTKIAFVSTRDAAFEGDYDIYVMNADGSDQTRLTNARGGDSDPAWSPDGTKIAFSGFREGTSSSEIYVMDAAPESETNLPKRLTRTHTYESETDWQPLP